MWNQRAHYSNLIHQLIEVEREKDGRMITSMQVLKVLDIDDGVGRHGGIDKKVVDAQTAVWCPRATALVERLVVVARRAYNQMPQAVKVICKHDGRQLGG